MLKSQKKEIDIMERKFLRLLGKPAVISFLRSEPISWLLSLFIPWMEINDELPEGPEGVRNIFLISYATTPTGLTRMSLTTTMRALELACRYPNSNVFACEFRDNPEGVQEFVIKKLLGLRSSVINRVHNAGKASSTTDERESLVAKSFEVNRGNLGPSIIVGNGAHIRRAQMVWRYFHPAENLWFVSTPMKEDDDPNNPMLAQRYW